MRREAHVLEDNWGRLLGQMRADRGVGAHTLGLRTGCTGAMIWRLEKGERAPSYQMVCALAIALELAGLTRVQFFARAHYWPPDWRI